MSALRTLYFVKYESIVCLLISMYTMRIGSRKTDKLKSLFEVWRGWFNNERRSGSFLVHDSIESYALCLSFLFYPQHHFYFEKCARDICTRKRFIIQLTIESGFKCVFQIVNKWINEWKTVCINLMDDISANLCTRLFLFFLHFIVRV